MGTKTQGARRPHGDAARRGSHRDRPNIVAKYDYLDLNRELLFQVVRLEPKSFRQRRKVGDRWVWSLGDVEPVLYRWPDIDWAINSPHGVEQPIYVVEGEKDVHTLVEQGHEATCNPMGAGKWRDSYSEMLRGADVVIVADDDPPGLEHAAKVAKSLIGVASNVRLTLPVEGCKDVAEHYAHGYGVDELRPLELTVENSDTPIPTFDLLLSRARDKATTDGRNEAAMWLVHQLRDNRYPEDGAREIVTKYQTVVNGSGDHAFTHREAMEVFDKHFFSEARDPWMPDTTGRPLTDYGNAERLVADHGEDLRYCHPWKSWLVWDGKRWRPDADDAVERRAKATMRELAKSSLGEPDEDKRKRLVQHAMRSESAPRLRAMIDLARSEEPVVVRPSELDRDPMVLTVDNGELLMGGDRWKLMDHHRGSMLTKLAPVQFNEKAEARLWAAFLERVVPDCDDRSLLRRAVGYSLTGDVSEHVMFVLHGTGANGKTTFLETIRAMLGEYAQQAPTDLITVKRPGAIPTDAARLQGARFVSASETEDGTRLAEATVKQLTGGDRITARRLYQDYFEFNPTHKLWLATNHRPVVMGTDDAIWRRLRLIPFEVTIPPEERDRKLSAKLRRELPGILNWALAGLEEWKREGLGESRHSQEATEEYRRESDVFGSFLEDCCVVGEDHSVSKADLFVVYETWATGEGLKPMAKRSLGRKMKERGFKDARQGRTNEHVWVGLGVPHLAETGKLRVLSGGRS